MNLFTLPWIELAVLVPLVGAVWVGRVREPNAASRWCMLFATGTFCCALLAWLQFATGTTGEATAYGPMARLLGRPVLTLDELSAPLLPLVALLHVLTALATARTKMARFSFAWLLASAAIAEATFACKEPWCLIGLLAAGAVLPYLELVGRGKPTRLYVLHMGLFLGLLVLGWASVEGDLPVDLQPAWAMLPLLLAVLLRSGTVPFHCWVTDLFEHASFGAALLFVTPLTGVYATVRLVLPFAPDWLLHGIGAVSLITAVYAAGMAVVQREARRFFAYLFLSHASLVLVGLELVTSISLTGALCLWGSVALSLGGLGLTLRALEARFGRLSLADYHGLYEHSPSLAVCFLLNGLASVGFPGTLGFISAELLVDGAIEANPYVGVGLAIAAAINGIALVRVYFLLFTGARHVATVSLGITLRERFAMLTLAALILGGGLYPQPGVLSRYLAAEALLAERGQRLHELPEAHPE